MVEIEEGTEFREDPDGSMPGTEDTPHSIISNPTDDSNGSEKRREAVSQIIFYILDTNT